ncbi:MAG: deoxyribodipyrimidine photo-lyase [Alkalispirochaeta sp.]
MAQDERVEFLNNKRVPDAPSVVYWVQASPRVGYNHALEYAIHLANHRKQPLHCVFCLTPGFPGANIRHYWFLFEGLRDFSTNLRKRGIELSVWTGEIGSLSDGLRGQASTIVTDRGYLRIQREWRRRIAEEADCPVVQVETNIVVPLTTASTREEYSAATIRRKIHTQWDRFLVPVAVQHLAVKTASGPGIEPVPESGLKRLDSGQITAPSDLTSLLDLDTTVAPVTSFHGGETEARNRLRRFLTDRFDQYGTLRNDPAADRVSRLSPYLHFGQISPVEIAVTAGEHAAAVAETGEHEGTTALRESLDTLLEELVVRRELAINFCEYNNGYDRYDSLPEWARATLEEHASDPRPHEYTLQELERAETADPYWNACQREMVVSGHMHGYMRMYWGKKILEWTTDPDEAYRRAIYLNDRYELDGRDPNGYAGVAWVFGKHDRPWVERSIFGKVRYMNANGLARKFKEIDRYVDRWGR